MFYFNVQLTLVLKLYTHAIYLMSEDDHFKLSLISLSLFHITHQITQTCQKYVHQHLVRTGQLVMNCLKRTRVHVLPDTKGQLVK